LLAPLAGITDSTFRRICKEQGASLVYSEMISAKGLYYNDKSTERLLSFYEEEMPIAYQIFGSDPEIMAWTVTKLSDRGNSILDVNMGCPVPKVAKNGEGSALMKTPELAAEIVTKMVKAEIQSAEETGRLRKPITVKCRIGWDEKSINVLDFALRMEEAGASAIAVHARTREQYYSGKADWTAIAEVKKRISIPVIGSGDIFSGEDANRMLAETGCDFVMIARGALGNPWIFADALALYEGRPLPPAPSLEEKLALIRKHLELQVAEKGEVPAVLEMRKHMGWYIKGIPGAAEIRRKVNTLTTADSIKAVLLELEHD
jgi:tRNA-dihydrouridine synthase B